MLISEKFNYLTFQFIYVILVCYVYDILNIFLFLSHCGQN